MCLSAYPVRLMALGLGLALGSGFAWAGEDEEAEALARMRALGQVNLGSDDAVRQAAARINQSVVSASNKMESLWGAPATVIVLTRDEMVRRGYRELDEILDDLPGMEVSRPYGDTFFKNYWRGFRNTFGDPFLVLVDGVVFNHMWGHNVQAPLATFPLSMVARVEVVYGPASVVYGADAFMGVINIITDKQSAGAGSHTRATLQGGSWDRRMADLATTWREGKLALSLAARFDNGSLDEAAMERYEYTRKRYYADPRIWDALYRDNPSFGPLRPPGWRNQAMHLRAAMEGTEFVYTHLVLATGYGTAYAGDQAQANGRWVRTEDSFHLRHERDLSGVLHSTTLVRWRSSGFPSDSFDIEGYFDKGQQGYVNLFTYWSADNRSRSLFQDFNLWLNWRCSLNFGFKYEQKDLQKAYNTSPVYPGPYLPVGQGVLPPPLVATDQPGNRVDTEDRGLYVLAKFRLNDRHLFHLGFRHDRNSVFGPATTLRGGWVSRVGAWTGKLLYGEAFQEPSQRTLYGGFVGAPSNPALKPERSRTWELSLGHSAGRVDHLLSLYQVNNRDTVTYLSNLGERKVIGADYHFQAGPFPSPIGQLRTWAYASRYFRAAGGPEGDSGLTATGRIGDLADNKLWAGVSLETRNGLQSTLRGRWVGRRSVVATNPVGEIPSFAVFDLNLSVPIQGLHLSLLVTNLLDRVYFHPGINSAGAGTTPGIFSTDAQGNPTWQGSTGYYSSLLAQPGRGFTLSLRLPF